MSSTLPPASTPPPTTSTPPQTASTPPPPPPPTDPRIAALRALFPDYDDLILSSVLDSVNGDQDRAIDALLGMSDPEYKPPQQQPQQPMTQTELDEQFARQLLLQEQDAWIARHAETPRTLPQRGPQRTQTQTQQQDGTGDTMADIQQHIGKFAETGKKTFNTLLSKVKAKIQESKSTDAGAGAGGSAAYDPAQYEQRTAAPRRRTLVPPSQQPAYYDPNPIPRAASPEGYDTTTTAVPGASQATPPGPGASQGYDTAPARTMQATPPDPSSAATPVRSLTSPPIDGGASRSSYSNLPSRFVIDEWTWTGKYGLLPKRPVTLLRPGESTQTQMQRQHSLDDSDDGLEYAESPFDEGKK
ncbi:hypothetical protein C0992_007828 [Termitomyces sp. T32_za158]|nr:hypothetical protein C0992_007828 [Termitomyces sp. T32_za158]